MPSRSFFTSSCNPATDCCVSFASAASGLPLHNPDNQRNNDDKQGNHTDCPLFSPSAQRRQLVAQFKHLGFKGVRTTKRIIKLIAFADPLPICGLQCAQLFGLGVMRVGSKIRIKKKVPDLFSALFGIQRLVLCIAHPTELLVDCCWLGAVALTHELDDAGACVNAAAYHAAQLALFSAENILPVWLVTQELKRVRHKLTRASQFLAYRRNEDDRAHRNRHLLVTKLEPADKTLFAARFAIFRAMVKICLFVSVLPRKSGPVAQR